MKSFSFSLLFFVFGAKAGNILVFNPTMGYSHVHFLGNIADILSRGGHNVTMLCPVFDREIEPFGTTEKAIHKIEMRHVGDLVGFNSQRVSYFRPWENPPNPGRSVEERDFFYLWYSTHKMFRAVLEDKELFFLLNSTRFDAAIAELYSYAPIGFFEALGIKTTVAAASLGTFPTFFDLTGLPRHPSFVPEFVTTYSERMSFWERLDSLFVSFLSRIFLTIDLFLQNSLIREFYPQMEDLHGLLMKRVGLILSNINEFTQSPRPLSHLIQPIGGASLYSPKPLPKEFEEILSLSNSTVLFSLGTVADTCTMPPTILNAITSTFSKFPEVNFLWKTSSCENGTKSSIEFPSNVFRMEWIPQSDLLADRRVKVFITHGGMNSMTEAVFRGIPVILIPLFADQYVNAENAVNRGYGISIRRELLTSERLTDALNKTLDPSGTYRRKAAQIAKMLRGKEEEYRREILRRVELLMEFGPLEHSRMPVDHLNLLQFYSIDCLLFIALTITLFTFGIVKLKRILESGTREKVKCM